MSFAPGSPNHNTQETKMSHPTLKGQCSCGAVTYACDGEPVMVAHCHCRDCQRSSGAAMATVFAVPKQAFHLLSGETRRYAYTGDSGQPVYRHFCPNCGAPLFTDVTVLPDLQFIRATSLDNPAQVTSSLHIYCDSAQPWGLPEDGLPHFGKLPG